MKRVKNCWQRAGSEFSYGQEVDEKVQEVNGKGRKVECYLGEVDEKVQEDNSKGQEGEF